MTVRDDDVIYTATLPAGLTIVTLTAVARPLTVRLPTWTRALPIYAMGSLAAFWMIERSLPLVR